MKTEKDTTLSTEDLVHKIRGNPKLILEYENRVKEFDPKQWFYLLNHCPNDMEIVGRCDKWHLFAVDDLCDLLCAHPQLHSACPIECLGRFKRGHWAKLVSSDVAFCDILEKLGTKENVVGDWCCPSHWAEDYGSIFKVQCAAASPSEDRVRRIAAGSAINPDFAGLGPSFPYRNNRALHIKWLAAVAADLAEMSSQAAKDNDERRAEEYSLIAQAANYQVQKMLAEI